MGQAASQIAAGIECCHLAFFAINAQQPVELIQFNKEQALAAQLKRRKRKVGLKRLLPAVEELGLSAGKGAVLLNSHADSIQVLIFCLDQSGEQFAARTPLTHRQNLFCRLVQGKHTAMHIRDNHGGCQVVEDKLAVGCFCFHLGTQRQVLWLQAKARPTLQPAEAVKPGVEADVPSIAHQCGAMSVQIKASGDNIDPDWCAGGQRIALRGDKAHPKRLGSGKKYRRVEAVLFAGEYLRTIVFQLEKAAIGPV